MVATDANMQNVWNRIFNMQMAPETPRNARANKTPQTIIPMMLSASILPSARSKKNPDKAKCDHQKIND